MYKTATVEIEGGPRWRCSSPPELAIDEGAQCIVDNAGILEFGRVTSLEETAGDMPSSKEMPRLMRRATLQDQSKAEENALMSKMGMKTCTATAMKRGLQIRLVQGRYSFDRWVFTVLFSCEDRVDIKDMVRDLAGDLRARVEMKQIGVRDEAGLIGGIGSCGRKLCCATWLRKFESINVRMAKAQGLSLNPAAIGGCCGRLKCCLSYEFDLYLEMGRRLPSQGARIQCRDGKGYVVERNILGQRVRVRLDDARFLEYGVADVKEIWKGKNEKRGGPDEDPGSERAESEPVREAGAGDLRDGDAGPDLAEG